MKAMFEITTKNVKNIDKISEFIRCICVEKYKVAFVSNHMKMKEVFDLIVVKGCLDISLGDVALTFDILKEKIEEFIRIYNLDVIFDMY